MTVNRTASDGDLVWLHLHVKHTPESLGGAGIQIFRMKEGKIVEHWGVGQPVPKESKNNNTMFWVSLWGVAYKNSLKRTQTGGCARSSLL